LRTEVVAERIIRKKKALMAQESKILHKIRILEMERNLDQEKSAKSDLKSFLIENLPLLTVSINRIEQRVSEDLTVKLVFNPCKHTKRIKLQELLRSHSHMNGKLVAATNQDLLMQWKLLFEMKSTAQGSRNCEKCREEKTSLRARFGSWNDRPVGTCRFSVGKLH